MEVNILFDTTSSGNMATGTNVPTPAVLRDPRFEAGRTLIQQGMANEGAIEIFSTLVEECIAKHGDSSIESSPVFFEYGNALLRAFLVVESVEGEEVDDDDDKEEEEKEKRMKDSRTAAAAAAEARRNAQEVDQDVKCVVGNDKEEEKNENEGLPGHDDNGVDENGELGEEKGEDESNDLRLSLEMMENAYSIMDDYQAQTDSESTNRDSQSEYLSWTKDQIPRVLLGIGDCLSSLERHADAADAYSRALEWRQAQLDQIVKSNKEENLAQLRCQRRVCEATVLIAEELLSCPEDEDVVTSETKTLIVQSDERIEYARGYYDKARDSLQDTVFLLGKLASKNVDLGTEKEDVCFLATMIMGVGETLAALDERDQEKKTAEPAKKKLKTSR